MTEPRVDDPIALGTDEQDDDQPFIPDDSNGYDTLEEFYDYQD